MNFKYTLFPFGDDAVVLHLGQDVSKLTNQIIRNVEEMINKNPFPGFIETEASFTTLTVYFDRSITTNIHAYETISQITEKIIDDLQTSISNPAPFIEIPVCYHPRLAPDLAEIARYNNVTISELIKIHSKESYFVSYVGFGKGIPFLGGTNSLLTSPRKKSSSIYIPYGAVGITGTKTGIYPIGTTVGWQIIGRAPVSILKEMEYLFQLNQEIRFKPISIEEYYTLESDEKTQSVSS